MEMSQGPMKVPVQNMGNRLHRLVGALNFDSINTSMAGRATGILISPNLVLTSAHNLFSNKTRQTYHNIKFYPSLNGPLALPYHVESYYYPTEFQQSPTPKYDYAILKLRQSVKEGQFIPLKSQHNFYSHTTIAIYGYPSSQYVPVNNAVTLAVHQTGTTAKGRVMGVNQIQCQIYHMLPTTVGMGGAPIVQVGQNGALSMVGIHKGQKRDKLSGVTTNCGVLFSPHIIEAISKQARHMGSEVKIV